jgi:hypothetical protein
LRDDEALQRFTSSSSRAVADGVALHHFASSCSRALADDEALHDRLGAIVAAAPRLAGLVHRRSTPAPDLHPVVLAQHANELAYMPEMAGFLR